MKNKTGITKVFRFSNSYDLNITKFVTYIIGLSLIAMLRLSEHKTFNYVSEIQFSD